MLININVNTIVDSLTPEDALELVKQVDLAQGAEDFSFSALRWYVLSLMGDGYSFDEIVSLIDPDNPKNKVWT